MTDHESIDDANKALDAAGIPRFGPMAALTIADRVVLALNEIASLKRQVAACHETLRETAGFRDRAEHYEAVEKCPGWK